MFSKKMVMVVGVIFLIAVGIIFLTVTSSRPSLLSGFRRIPIAFVGPFQDAVTHTMHSARNVWKHYFALVSTSKENDRLKKALSMAVEANSQCEEIRLSNKRLRKLLNFQKTETSNVLAAEVVGKDPSAWYNAVIIDKGSADGVEKGMPVVVHEGVAGQVVEASGSYAKALLIIDRNSAVDAVIQRSRARGIIKGHTSRQCLFEYVLRKHDVRIGDTVVSSGLDGVYPKGLRIGRVSGVVKRTAGMFQEVSVEPFADFEKLEEVLIVLGPRKLAKETK